MENSMIVAIRIYYDDYMWPMADLKTCDGSIKTIRWNDVEQRNEFMPYINGYTLIYDERSKRLWDEW